MGNQLCRDDSNIEKSKLEGEEINVVNVDRSQDVPSYSCRPKYARPNAERRIEARVEREGGIGPSQRGGAPPGGGRQRASHGQQRRKDIQ